MCQRTRSFGPRQRRQATWKGLVSWCRHKGPHNTEGLLIGRLCNRSACNEAECGLHDQGHAHADAPNVWFFVQSIPSHTTPTRRVCTGNDTMGASRRSIVWSFVPEPRLRGPRWAAKVGGWHLLIQSGTTDHTIDGPQLGRGASTWHKRPYNRSPCGSACSGLTDRRHTEPINWHKQPHNRIRHVVDVRAGHGFAAHSTMNRAMRTSDQPISTPNQSIGTTDRSIRHKPPHNSAHNEPNNWHNRPYIRPRQPHNARHKVR